MTLSGKLTNGGIRVDSEAGAVDVETHNGGVEVSCAGESVRLVTHNGSIKLDATRSGTLGGLVETYNGEVNVRLADVVVVNTCAFVSEAREESVATILELHEQRAEGSELVVTGCMAERYGAELAEALPKPRC